MHIFYFLLILLSSLSLSVLRASKTLQSVGLVYTLLTQGFEEGHPIARKVIIVTPTSLVANWRNEIEKWLGKGVLNVVALSEVGKDNIECGLDDYTRPNSKAHVLIVSYDTFRRHVDRLSKPGLCDLLICDEAHRSVAVDGGTRC